MAQYTNDAQFNTPDLDSIMAEEFFATYKNFLFAVGRRITSDSHVIMTAIDDLAIQLCCKRKHNFDPTRGTSFKSYLAAMMRNRCYTEMRWDKKYVFLDEAMLDATCRETGDISNLLEHALRADQCDRMIRQALRQMSEKVRDRRKMEAFTRLVIDEERPADVARNTRMDIHEIYQVKAQLLPRYRAILRRLDDAC